MNRPPAAASSARPYQMVKHYCACILTYIRLNVNTASSKWINFIFLHHFLNIKKYKHCSFLNYRGDFTRKNAESPRFSICAPIFLKDLSSKKTPFSDRSTQIRIFILCNRFSSCKFKIKTFGRCHTIVQNMQESSQEIGSNRFVKKCAGGKLTLSFNFYPCTKDICSQFEDRSAFHIFALALDRQS